MAKRLYMVVERFRDGDAISIYRRLRDRGRMMPEGLDYVASWIDEKMERCWQVMETADPALFEAWISHWRDLMEFEVIPVSTSKATIERLAPRL